MTAYTAIPDSDIDPESPGTTTLFTRLRDNPIAVLEGNAVAKIANAAFAAGTLNGDKLVTDSVTATQIAAGAVAESELGNGAAHRAKLYTTVISLAGTITTGTAVDISMNAYAFFPMVHVSDISGTKISGHSIDGANPDLPRFSIYNNLGTDVTYDVDYRYVLT